MLKDLLYYYDQAQRRGSAAATAFSPTDIASLIMWLNAATVNQAAASTIQTWEDSTANNNDGTQSTAANRPTYVQSALNSLPSVLFDGTNDYLNGNSIVPTTNGSFSKAAVVTCSGFTSRLNNILSATTTTDSHALRLADAGSNQGYVRFTVRAFAAVASGIPLAVGSGIFVHGSYDAAENMLVSYVNGMFGNYIISTGDNADATLHIGTYNNDTASAFYGTISDALVFNNNLEHDNLHSIAEYFLDRYGIRNKPRRKIVFKGGSWTQGYNITGQGTVTGSTYPAQVLSQLSLTNNVDVDAFNVGVFGQPTSAMIDAPYDVYNKFDAYADKNVLLFWGGSNDIDAGDSAATALASAETYARRARIVGYKTIGITLLPRVSVNANYETSRLTYNTSLLASTDFDEVIDVTAGTVFASSGIILDTNIYQGDQIHLTASGYSIIASSIAPILSTFL